MEHLCALPPKRQLLPTSPATAGTAAHTETPLRACSCPNGLDFFPSIQWENIFAVRKDAAVFGIAAVPASTESKAFKTTEKAKYTLRIHMEKTLLHVFFFFLFFSFCFFKSKTSFFCSFRCFSTHAPSRKLNAMQMKRVQLESPPRGSSAAGVSHQGAKRFQLEKREQETEELPEKHPTSDLYLMAKR